MLAEDDRRQAEALRRYLTAEGHEATVVHDGEAALRAARQETFDLLLLDVMLPGLDGMQICRILRQESDVLMLMLTARSSEDDLLRGLDLGADDYMTKPFSPGNWWPGSGRCCAASPRRPDTHRCSGSAASPSTSPGTR